MLIQFSVTNYRSIRETQTLSMVAGSAKEHRQSNTVPSGLSDLRQLVRSAVIYGPNAAGKTNVLKALQFMQQMVITSAGALPDVELPYTPFKLSSISRDAPSEFEVVFIQEGTRYEYGFSLIASRILREWLIEYPRGRGRRLFDRRYDKKQDSYVWDFSSFFRGNRLSWRNNTKKESLFLSTAIQLNSTHLLPVFAWFQRRMVAIVGINSLNQSLTPKLLETPDGKRRVLPFVREADPWIADVQVQREALPAFGTMIAQGVAPPIIDISAPGSPPNLLKISFSHAAIDTKEAVKIDLADESSGTQALFRTAGAWLNVFENGEVLVFDEIDTSLHPLLTRFLVQQFHSNENNPNGAQLIFSTHDTTLLDKDVFRRDQIWFVEKGDDRATKVFPLTEFSPRSDEALERSYLRGRYGALPIFDAPR